MGARRPQVVVAMDHPVPALALNLRNGPGANRVKIWSGDWSIERGLDRDEVWRVEVPVPPGARAVTVGFEVEHGFVPAQLDSKSGDRRSLGCWVRLE
jgi:hypothetical protein